jgi:hypothetical protein
MVTAQEMRTFALECLRWADETDDASQREIMIELAKTWMNAANQIELHVATGAQLVRDLRAKLD